MKYPRFYIVFPFGLRPCIKSIFLFKKENIQNERSKLIIKLLFLITPMLVTFQASSQSLSKLKKQYDQAGQSESIDLGLQVLTVLEDKYGINHSRYRAFFFDYIQSLNYTYYNGNLTNDEINIMDSLSMQFLKHREGSDPVIKVTHEYGTFYYDENGGRFNDAMHILCDIYGNTNALQRANDDMNPVFVKSFSNFYLEQRQKDIGQGDPRLLAEMVIILDNYEKIKNYLWNDKLDSEIKDLQMRISSFKLGSVFSNYEFVSEMGYLLSYLIRNEHFILANDLINLFTKGYSNTPVATKKELNPFFEFEHKYVQEGSYNSNCLHNDYELIFDYLLSVNLINQAKLYADILKEYANLNTHYPDVKYLSQSKNYDELIRYCESEVVNKKYTITNLTPPEWIYFPSLHPDDIPLYPMIVEAYYRTGDKENATTWFKEWFFYNNTLYDEKIDLKTVKVHKKMEMTVTFTSRPVSTFSSYVNPATIGEELSVSVAKQQALGRNAFMISDLIDEKTKLGEVEFVKFLQQLLDDCYDEFNAVCLLLPEYE